MPLFGMQVERLFGMLEPEGSSVGDALSGVARKVETMRITAKLEQHLNLATVREGNELGSTETCDSKQAAENWEGIFLVHLQLHHILHLIAVYLIHL
jgi:hypothetical protein